MHYVKGDADLTLVLQDNEWVSKGEADRPINQENVNAMLKQINDIKADRIIAEKPENLADYGLDKPASLLEVSLKNGTTATVKIGNAVGNSLGYYGLVNNDGIVYLLPVDMGSAFQYDNTQMTAVKSGPSITAADIYYINVDNKGGNSYELKKDETPKFNNIGNNMFPWRIIKPYGEGYTADDARIQEVQSYFTTFDFIKCVDYKGEDLSKYGLNDPAVTIDIGYYIPLPTPSPSPTDAASQTGNTTTLTNTGDPHEYKLYVGNTDPDGNYYVREDGSNSVYTINNSIMDRILKLSTFSMVNTYTCLPKIDDVDKVEIGLNGTNYTIDIKRTTQKDKDGKDTTVATYYFNGKAVVEKALKEMYQKLISTHYDAEIKGEIKTDGITPYFTMSYHLFGANEMTVASSFLPYDDSFYIVKKPDGTYFFADKRKIDAIADAFTTYVGTVK
jgi:hypothetical protein